MPEGGNDKEQPKLVNRHEHKKAVFVAGRTIGEKRERLETKRERAAAREKDKRKKRIHFIVVTAGFIVLIAILVVLIVYFLRQEVTTLEPEPAVQPVVEQPSSSEPTIEIIDDSNPSGEGKISSRMKTYIGYLESDVRAYGYKPIKAVIPVGSIREVDLYIEGCSGYFKTTIDRDAAVTAEDIDRMLRYFAGQGIAEFEYVDVRVDGRAFWKEKAAAPTPPASEE